MNGALRRRHVIRDAITSPGMIPNADHGPRPNGKATNELCFTGVPCVVAIVKATVCVLLQPVSTTVAGLKTQVVPAGRPLHEKLMLPV